MAKSSCIAVVGKGGVGKTTIAAFTVKYLLERSYTPILAVDADPSACLAGVLGQEIEETIGGIREDTRAVAGGIPEGIPKQQYLALKVQEAITEAKGFDLLTMGRPEGPGCYCFVNNVLRDNLDRLTQTYRATVIDCEAGLEHLSRRTSRSVDTMMLIADPTIKALDTLKTVLTIAAEIDNPIGRFVLILNRVPVGKEDAVRQVAASRLDLSRFEDVLVLPQDDAIFDAELAGQSILHIDDQIPSYQAYRRFVEQLSPALVR